MRDRRRWLHVDRQQNNIGFGWAFLVVAALSVIVYVLALRSRLSPAEARAQLATTDT